MPSIEHDRLTEMAARWLKRNGFGVVATELTCQGSREQPDAIGFRSEVSAIIEVKVSRADFKADLNKPERQSGGLGLYRFYLCPADLIQPDDLPAGWGLLYARGRGIEAVVAPRGNAWPQAVVSMSEAVLEAPWSAEWVAFQHDPDLKAERSALYSIARRAQATQTKA
ncbi:hypothetical protein NPJ88_000045 [Halomonas elongata]|uniref:hypothetical protein n=1 Tax=Halomonas elongata TaxID=2746 RepID=UPI00255AF402|nr:hypothetical protein [Halomonas elongata]MDL4860712.1 hypothetical protein [Halomonas elongata]